MKGNNLTSSFWDEAINNDVYLKNRCWTKILDHKTPSDAFYGYKPKVNHLRVFGCKAFAHIPKYERRKLDTKSIKCTFIGYCDDKKTYKSFDPTSHRFHASRDVVFHENVDEGAKMNNTGVWHDIDDYVKIEASCEEEEE